MFSLEIRNEVLEEFFDNKKVSNLSEKYQVSKSTIYKWVKEIGYNKETQQKFNNIFKLVKESKFNLALREAENNKKLCEYINELYSNFLIVKSKEINRLIEANKLNEALDECKEEYCQQDLAIQSQKITILIKLNRLNEALAECKEEYCHQNLAIQSQKEFILKKVKNNSFEYKEENKKSEIIQLVWYLYNKILTPNKIQESSISDFEKIIFTCAYYEQTNKINGVKFLKKQLKEENFTPKQFQRLKELLEHMKVNHKIFDMAFYNKILTGNSHIDFEGFTLPEEKEEKRIIPVEQVKIEKSAVSLKNKRDFFVPSQKQVQAVEPSVIPTKVKKIVKEKTHKPTQTLREKYYKEILRLEKIIYIAMQTRVLQEQQEAMKAWDILENISSQPSDNKEALEKLSRILKKCNF